MLELFVRDCRVVTGATITGLFVRHRCDMTYNDDMTYNITYAPIHIDTYTYTQVHAHARTHTHRNHTCTHAYTRTRECDRSHPSPDTVKKYLPDFAFQCGTETFVALPSPCQDYIYISKCEPVWPSDKALGW